MQGYYINPKEISGTVKKFTNPNEDYSGKIILLEETSPIITLISKQIKGILCKVGGKTSHIAIISRELGIPCVVGIGNNIYKINDGDIIKIHKDGRIEIVESNTKRNNKNNKN